MILRIPRCSKVILRRAKPAHLSFGPRSDQLRLRSPDRNFATEATSLPKSLLLRQKPPSAPNTQAQRPESAAPLPSAAAPHDLPVSEQDIDDYVLSFHRRLIAQSGQEVASLTTLYDQLDSQARIVLDEELPYEDTPAAEKRIAVEGLGIQRTWLESCRLAAARLAGKTVQEPMNTAEDGLILVAHTVEASPAPITSWSLGFLVTTSQGTQYAVSCSHTLESAAHALRKRNYSSSEVNSSTLLLTRGGQLLPVTAIVSSLPLHDLVIYSFMSASARTDRPLKAAPVALYPPQIGTEQSLFMVGQDQWTKGRVIGYKDSRGNDAEVGALPGTYDELTSISIDVIPTPGSSGGPLVSSNGAVTGLVRGSRMAFGDRRSAGFATPAEKIFEMFQLPGLPRKVQK